MNGDQRGSSMMEALVALLILSLGLLAYAELQSRAHVELLLHRLRQTAWQMALQSSEQTRHALRDAAPAANESTVLSSERTGPTQFRILRSSQALGGLSAWDIRVNVSWEDPDGQTESIELSTMAADSQAELTRALFVEPPPLGP
ncbi:MAG: hypothetical protein JO370_06935 [Paucibacter sp.]|nr:hypothetical protein [Roseateles sp.]